MKKLYILWIAFVSICSMLFWWIIYAGLTNTWTNPMELLASSWSNLSSENWNKVLSNQSILSEKIENLWWKNYSTEETFTWDYWIDWKKIYMKVVPFSVAISTSWKLDVIDSSLSSNNFDIIKTEFSAERSDWIHFVSITANPNTPFFWLEQKTSWLILWNRNDNIWNNLSWTVIVYYTKKSE